MFAPMIERNVSAARSAGFLMIDCLVALALVLIGLLGLAGLHARLYQGETEAYQRTQALVLLRVMVDGIEAHRQAATCFGFTTTATGTPYIGNGGTLPVTCTATGVAATDQGALDTMTAWDNLIKGAGEVAGGSNVGAIVKGVGCVALDLAPNAITPDRYTVAVAWQGLTDLPTLSPPGDASTGEKNAAACGTGLFGNALRRRVVWTTIEMAKLR